MSLHRLVLLRHGQTTWNAEGRMQGRLDPDLDATGRAQAGAAAPFVAEYDPVVLVSSDQARAWQTAEAVGKATGLVPRPEPRLRETALGAWEGLDGAEVEESWPGQVERWRSDPTFRPPEGEARTDVADRARPVVDELAEELGVEEDRSTVVLVAHGGTIIALTGSLLGLELSAWPALAPLRNCRWTVLVHSLDRWRLGGWGLHA